MTLHELTASSRRLAFVGLAKNTGKTEALAALLRELQAAGLRVGVTSVGRDGEQRDVIDPRIEKPRVTLSSGSLLATTDELLRASGIAHELLEDPGVRTPLGRVQIARLLGAGAIEVAGPSAAADVRAVSDAMLAHGAGQVLIDGAIDRRAASSPHVSDALVISTGAVLDRDIDEVVRHTRDAVELVRLPLDEAGGEQLALPPRFALTADGEQIANLLDAHPTAVRLLVAGALPERFLLSLLRPAARRGRELTLIVADPTRVFLASRGPEWFRGHGIHLRARERIGLRAIAVNPLAPRSHRFDSARLRGLLEAAIPAVPVLDVLHADYE
ncbi:MAG TPA: hypothetical protein VK790_06830 [Solirubrobacteraceae bacterium]|nr:hypothetical protein [Solirubrobacteraceae bacterium]